MYYAQLETICQCLFGRSWKSQLADYLMIDRRRVQDWEKSGKLPDFVSSELTALIARRKLEVNSVDKLSGDNFYHEKAMLNGETHYLEVEKAYTENEIKQFIDSQKWNVIEDVKSLIKREHSLDEVIEYIEVFFLSKNDIASFIEDNNIQCELDIDTIKDIRAEACHDCKLFAENKFN